LLVRGHSLTDTVTEVVNYALRVTWRRCGNLRSCRWHAITEKTVHDQWTSTFEEGVVGGHILWKHRRRVVGRQRGVPRYPNSLHAAVKYSAVLARVCVWSILQPVCGFTRRCGLPQFWI